MQKSVTNRAMSKPHENIGHETFLRRAIELSQRASLEYCTGGVFGAVLVKDSKIVSEGMNRVIASHDPTWHAEMEAIRLACVTLQSLQAHGLHPLHLRRTLPNVHGDLLLGWWIDPKPALWKQVVGYGLLLTLYAISMAGYAWLLSRAR